MDVTALLIKLLDFFGKKKVIMHNANNSDGSLSMKVQDGRKIINVWVHTTDLLPEGESTEEKGQDDASA